MADQPAMGLRTVTRKEEGLHGVDIAYGVSGDFGTQKKGEVVYCSDEKTFWEAYMSAINIGGVQVKLGTDTPPLPEVLARKLLEQDDEYIRMKMFLEWVRDVATPEQLVVLSRKMQALK